MFWYNFMSYDICQKSTSKIYLKLKRYILNKSYEGGLIKNPFRR